MEPEDWVRSTKVDILKLKKEKTKTRALEDLKHIEEILDDTYGYGSLGGSGKRIKTIETDGLMIIAWRIGNDIHHYLVGLGHPKLETGHIYERGIENWPRGETKKLETLSAMLDARIVDDDDRVARSEQNLRDIVGTSRTFLSQTTTTENPDRTRKTSRVRKTKKSKSVSDDRAPIRPFRGSSDADQVATPKKKKKAATGGRKKYPWES